MVGAVVGLVGAAAAAIFTVNKESKQVREAAASEHQNAFRRAEDQRVHDAAGRMTVHILATFDELRGPELPQAEPSTEDFEPLRRQVDEHRK